MGLNRDKIIAKLSGKKEKTIKPMSTVEKAMLIYSGLVSASRLENKTRYTFDDKNKYFKQIPSILIAYEKFSFDQQTKTGARIKDHKFEISIHDTELTMDMLKDLSMSFPLITQLDDRYINEYNLKNIFCDEVDYIQQERLNYFEQKEDKTGVVISLEKENDYLKMNGEEDYFDQITRSLDFSDSVFNENSFRFSKDVCDEYSDIMFCLREINDCASKYHNSDQIPHLVDLGLQDKHEREDEEEWERLNEEINEQINENNNMEDSDSPEI